MTCILSKLHITEKEYYPVIRTKYINYSNNRSLFQWCKQKYSPVKSNKMKLIILQKPEKTWLATPVDIAIWPNWELHLSNHWAKLYCYISCFVGFSFYFYLKLYGAGAGGHGGRRGEEKQTTMTCLQWLEVYTTETISEIKLDSCFQLTSFCLLLLNH